MQPVDAKGHRFILDLDDDALASPFPSIRIGMQRRNFNLACCFAGKTALSAGQALFGEVRVVKVLDFPAIGSSLLRYCRGYERYLHGAEITLSLDR